MKSRLELRVGVFVLTALILMGVLLLSFSKGSNLFEGSTYDIMLTAGDVSGLKTRANVLMAGVVVGSVKDIELGPEGKSVTITLRIYKKHQIHTDARFILEQSGFLGDEFVSILPTANQGPLFTNGQPATAEVPFNFLEAARNANGFLLRIDETANKLNAAIARVDKLVLNEQTLTNLAVSVANFRHATEGAMASMDRIDRLVDSNSPAITLAVSNFGVFSDELKQSGNSLNQIIETNGPEIRLAISNIETSSEVLKGLLKDVQSGKGVAGGLIENQQMATNLAVIVENLSVTSSNLNKFGLWHMMWRHKPPKTEAKSTAAKQKKE
jgi:phospholipid/cholesterol/gamma-HCH transport system substrate-binding protein